MVYTRYAKETYDAFDTVYGLVVSRQPRSISAGTKMYSYIPGIYICREPSAVCRVAGGGWPVAIC